MRAFVTGQVGVDKGPYLEAVAAEARAHGHDLHICHVGKMMYAEAPDVPAGRILNLPITRLNALRRAVFKEILRAAEQHEHVLVNTHATFRWRHGCLPPSTSTRSRRSNADLYVTLLDNVESVHQRLVRDHETDHSLKDLMVWREEEGAGDGDHRQHHPRLRTLFHGQPGREKRTRRAGAPANHADHLPPHVRELSQEGVSQLPHEPRDGPAGHALGN